MPASTPTPTPSILVCRSTPASASTWCAAASTIASEKPRHRATAKGRQRCRPFLLSSPRGGAIGNAIQRCPVHRKIRGNPGILSGAQGGAERRALGDAALEKIVGAQRKH